MKNFNRIFVPIFCLLFSVIALGGEKELTDAACSGNRYVVLAEIQKGSPISDRAILCSAITGDAFADVTELMLQHGANPKEAIYKAVQYDSIKTAIALIKYGADKHFKSSDGWTLLMWAANVSEKEFSPELTALLLSRGNDPKSLDRDGLSAAHFLIGGEPIDAWRKELRYTRLSCENKLNILDQLLNAGLDLRDSEILSLVLPNSLYSEVNCSAPLTDRLISSGASLAPFISSFRYADALTNLDFDFIGRLFAAGYRLDSVQGAFAGTLLARYNDTRVIGGDGSSRMEREPLPRDRTSLTSPLLDTWFSKLVSQGAKIDSPFVLSSGTSDYQTPGVGNTFLTQLTCLDDETSIFNHDEKLKLIDQALLAGANPNTINQSSIEIYFRTQNEVLNVDTLEKYPPLFYSIFSCISKPWLWANKKLSLDKDVILRLIKGGANVDQVDARGRTAIIEATFLAGAKIEGSPAISENYALAVIELFSALKADLKLKDNSGKTSCDYARHSHTLLQALQSRGGCK